MIKHKEDFVSMGQCWTCEHFIPIGEGDHICDASLELGIKIPVSDYEPTEDYMWCGGEKYEGK